MPADPLEALRQPVAPIAPRHGLRRRAAGAGGRGARPGRDPVRPLDHACGRSRRAGAVGLPVRARRAGRPRLLPRGVRRDRDDAHDRRRRPGRPRRDHPRGHDGDAVRRAPGDRRRQPRDPRGDAGQPLPPRRRRRRHVRPGPGRWGHRRAPAGRPVPRQPQRLAARPVRPSLDDHAAHRSRLRRGDGPARSRLHGHRGARAGRRTRGPGPDRPARLLHPVGAGRRPGRGVLHRAVRLALRAARAGAARARPTATSTTPRCRSASTTPWTTRARTTTTGSTICRR